MASLVTRMDHPPTVRINRVASSLTVLIDFGSEAAIVADDPADLDRIAEACAAAATALRFEIAERDAGPSGLDILDGIEDQLDRRVV